MSSITTSEEIASVVGLSLAFQLRQYRANSVRQLFVDAVHNPRQTFFRPQRSHYVLKEVCLSLKDGDRVGLLGVNGSGKTTLCRCIAGMLRPDRGTIHVKGSCRAIFNTTAGVIPELTGRENGELLARFLYPDQSDAEIARLLKEAFDFSELGAFLDAPYETYSQGMKGRLSLSVLTAKSSDLLILDEVYDNTDQFFQAKMSLRMQQVIHASRAVLFVSHSKDLIRRSCNRALVLHQNRIVFDGSVTKALAAYELLNSPGSA